MPQFSEDLQTALDAARKASAIIKKYAASALKSWDKSHDNPVTHADLESDQIIRETLLKKFPNDGWLSEETKDNADRLSKKRIWIVDPIDGTKEFIHQIPEYAVSIGLAVDGEVVLGVVCNPATDEIFYGEKGQGVYYNDKRTPMNPLKKLNESLFLASRSETKKGKWKPYEKTIRIQEMGSIAYKMALVAVGKADASFSLAPKSEWDIAAGTFLIEENGGKVLDNFFQPILFNQVDPKKGGIVYSRPELIEPIRSLIQENPSF